MIFNIYSKAYRRNPYPYFRKLMSVAPVCRIKPHGHWAVSRYADVQTILKNPNIFISSGMVKELSSDSPEFFLFSRGLIGADPPDHTRLRRLLSKAFTPVMIRKLQSNIRLICTKLIDNLLSQHSVDFIQAFAVPLPMTVISELLGIDLVKMNDFKRWTSMLISWRNQHQSRQFLNDVENMYYYFTDLIAERKKNPQTDLISTLISACDDDKIITNEEVLAFIRLLLVAGTETTTNLLGNAMLLLLTYPNQLTQLKQDPAKISKFIEESLRYSSPVISLSRTVNTKIKMSGITLNKGDIVLPLVASANHDETVFPNSQQFNIDRNTQGHLAFGDGIHYCLGSQLARLQVRIAFEEIFKAFDTIDKSYQGSLTYLDSFFFRGVKKLDLVMKKDLG
jgi:cytochrome P450